MSASADIKHALEKYPAVMLYFSAPSCGVCHALAPKLINALEVNFPRFKTVLIDISSHPELTSHFGVYTVPTVLVYFEGKEFIRKSRNMSVPGLVEEIRRPYELLMLNSPEHSSGDDVMQVPLDQSGH